MDESFSVSGSKFPPGEDPDGDWTVEEVIHWAHSQYRHRAVEGTERAIAGLREQCERECEDVMTLHGLAVDMAARQGEQEGGNGGAGGAGSGVEGGEENVDPQSSSSVGAGAADGAFAKPSSASSSTSSAGAAAGAGNATRPSSASTIEIQVTVGPHSGSSYVLRPRPGVPCLVGRSKGKKFARDGISLHRDQEVSTTHGKFVSEGVGLGGAGNEGGGGKKFYFIDVGSTNGTVHAGEQLEPNKRLLLEEGTELRVGNSTLKVVLG